MRNILVDHARNGEAHGDQDSRESQEKHDVDLLGRDDALTRSGHSSRTRPRSRTSLLWGLFIDENAEVPDVPHATVERHWRFAKSGLRQESSE